MTSKPTLTPRRPITINTAYGWGFADAENGTQEHKPEDPEAARFYWMGWNAAQPVGGSHDRD